MEQTLSNFTIQSHLGQGGMGQVYLAYDNELRRKVALKIMHSHLAETEQFQERFVQEAQIAARLGDHPHIVTIYSFSRQPPSLLLVMEYVATGSLRAFLRDHYQTKQEYLPLDEVVELIGQIGAALDYAHHQGVIHRDIKPDNVLLKQMPGNAAGFQALLTDFGLAKLAEDAGFHTKTGVLVGTFHYMAPEQFEMPRRFELSPATDLYALGIVLYELVVGTLPFRPRDVWEAADMHLKQTPPLPSLERAGLPEGFDAVLMRALAKTPGERYPSGAALHNALKAALHSAPVALTELETGPLRAEKIDSLTNYLHVRSTVAANQELTLTPPAAPLVMPHSAYDQLLIWRPDGAQQVEPLRLNDITLGRTADNTIVLSDVTVSRHHARLRRQPDGSYLVEDVGSSGGTFLGEARLLPNLPEVWSPAQTLRLGRYQLQLQVRAGVPHLALEQDTAQVKIETPASPPPVSRTALLTSGNAPVAISFAPNPLVLEAGGQATLQVDIVHMGSLVEHYRLVLEGLPAEWVTVPGHELQLMPGTAGAFTLSLHPPRRWSSTAGTHRFTLHILSRTREGEVAAGEGTLTLRPFDDFAVDLHPTVVRLPGTAEFTIHQRGNAPASFSVTARDEEGALQFNPPEKPLTIRPGHKEKVTITLSALAPPPAERRVKFEVRAASESDVEQGRSGEAILTPVVPVEKPFYIFIDPAGQRHPLTLPESAMPAAGILEWLRPIVRLPAGVYFLASGKTEQRILPGQTLREVGLHERDIVLIRLDVTAAPAPSTVAPPPPVIEKPTYIFVDPQQKRHTLTLPEDHMPVVSILEWLRRAIRLPAGDYALVNGKTGVRLMPGQRLPEAGLRDKDVLLIEREVKIEEKPLPPTIRRESPPQRPVTPPQAPPPVYGQPLYMPPAPYPAPQRRRRSLSCIRCLPGLILLSIIGVIGAAVFGPAIGWTVADFQLFFSHQTYTGTLFEMNYPGDWEQVTIEETVIFTDSAALAEAARAGAEPDLVEYDAGAVVLFEFGEDNGIATGPRQLIEAWTGESEGSWETDAKTLGGNEAAYARRFDQDCDAEQRCDYLIIAVEIDNQFALLVGITRAGDLADYEDTFFAMARTLQTK